MCFRIGVFGFLLLCASGCAESRIPTAPLPSPTAPELLGAIYGSVHAATTGQCLAGATIELLDGPRPGERVLQTEAFCIWHLDELPYVFKLGHLPLGETLMLRASLDGYESRVVQVRVTAFTASWGPSTEMLRLELTPER